jgi:hypothetical protein
MQLCVGLQQSYSRGRVFLLFSCLFLGRFGAYETGKNPVCFGVQCTVLLRLYVSFVFNPSIIKEALFCRCLSLVGLST